MEIHQKISILVSNYLRENKVKQRELAEKAGVHQSHVSRIITGNFTDIYASQFQAIFDEVGIDIEAIESERRLPMSRDIESAIYAVWDGSQRQARAISKAIISMGQLSSGK